MFLDGEIKIQRIYEECWPFYGAWPFSHVLSLICGLVSLVNFSPILGPPDMPYYQIPPHCWIWWSWKWKEVGAAVIYGAGSLGDEFSRTCCKLPLYPQPWFDSGSLVSFPTISRVLAIPSFAPDRLTFCSEYSIGDRDGAGKKRSFSSVWIHLEK